MSPVSSSAPPVLVMMVAFYGLGLANIFIRSTMGVLAPELADELALSPRMLGLIASVFFLAYALFQIPTGILLDRFGPRRAVTGLFLLTVGGTFLFAAAESGPVMLLARVLMGIGCAGIFAGGFMVIGRFFAPDRLTTIGGGWNAFAMLGTFLATAPLAAAVAVLGWRDSFVGIGIAMAALTLLTGWAVRDRPPGAAPATARTESPREILAGLREVLATPGILAIASAGIALSAGNTILGIWGGPYLNDVHGLDQIGRGQVLLFMAFSGVAGHVLYGQAARRFNSLKRMVMGGATAIAAIMTTLALLPAPGIVTVTVLLSLLGLACGFPSILLAHARAIVPDRLAGRGITTVNTGVMVSIAVMQICVGTVIGAVAPSETGGATPTGYRAAFGFIAGMALTTLLLYGRVRDKPPRG